MAIKIIFVDIDGVLNSEEYYVARAEELGVENINKDFPLSEFCPKLVSNLNRITDKTGAKIVVSSSWRHRGNIQHLQELFRDAGITGEVVDKTPDLGDVIRGHEIEEWLTFHPSVKSWVILDDDEDMLDEQLPNFVHTHYRFGLTKERADRAIEIICG